jgi:hypothetical protein
MTRPWPQFTSVRGCSGDFACASLDAVRQRLLFSFFLVSLIGIVFSQASTKQPELKVV